MLVNQLSGYSQYDTVIHRQRFTNIVQEIGRLGQCCEVRRKLYILVFLEAIRAIPQQELSDGAYCVEFFSEFRTLTCGERGNQCRESTEGRVVFCGGTCTRR